MTRNKSELNSKRKIKNKKLQLNDEVKLGLFALK